MDHGGAGLSRQLALGDHGGHRRRRHRLAALVDDEAAVGVAVECQPDVGTRLDDEALQVDQVGRIERVGLVIRERAVEFEVQRHHRHRRNRAEYRRGGQACHPVARVDGHPQRSQRGHVDQRPQKGAVVVEHIAVADGAGGPVELRHTRDELIPDGGQPAVLPDGFGARPAQLDAVVGGRVVARGEHRAGAVQQPGGEIQLVGGGQTDPDDVEALGRDPGRERRRQRRRTLPHVVADDHPAGVRADQTGEGGTDVGHECLVDLLADEATHVICLDHTGNRRSGSRHN